MRSACTAIAGNPLFLNLAALLGIIGFHISCGAASAAQGEWVQGTALQLTVS